MGQNPAQSTETLIVLDFVRISMVYISTLGAYKTSFNNSLHDIFADKLFGNCELICITEIWLNDNIPSRILVNENDFAVFRADRHEREGGGVCIITNNINTTMISIPDQDSDVEILAVDICTSTNYKHRIIYIIL